MKSSPLPMMVWRLVALCALALALAGLLLPLLPTTPLVLLALWAARRSSPELANRIRSHPRLGLVIDDWEQHGALPLRAKLTAVLMIAGGWLVVLTSLGATPALLMLPLLIAVAAYLWTRPLPPRDPRPALDTG